MIEAIVILGVIILYYKLGNIEEKINQILYGKT